ncbi:MAG: inositol monophosphatase family protein [Chloroherpetonaceae bacterium]|nr:inositol monophosphatase family protein [Chloroherpetonaceae bacterium]
MTKDLIAAIDAAKAAGKHAKRNFGKLREAHISMKDRNDFVTTVDKKCEELAARAIRKKFPEDSIQGEEGTLETGSSGRKWVIDPLDGTTNFIHSLPTFSVSIALIDSDNDIRVGAIYHPSAKELFTAERGKGAYLNNRRIKVTRNFRTFNLLLATGFPYKIQEQVDQYLALFKDFLLDSSGIRRPGSAAIDLAYTACGRFDGFWELGLNAWDMAAGALMVREAGGLVTDFDGNNHYLSKGHIVASNGKIHPWMLEKVQRHFPLEPNNS